MLIVVAHGSRDPRWRTSVEAVVNAVAFEIGPDAVRLAYMDLTPPTLMDVVSAAAGAGESRVRILPMFLASEGHVERDIEPMVEAVRKACPEVRVELLPPLGQVPEFRDMLSRIARRPAARPLRPEPVGP